MQFDAHKRILIMAGGTGGHIFPAQSIAEQLQSSGATVEWLGAKGGFEIEIIGKTNIPLHLITVTGLRGKGVKRLILAPFMITKAIVQAIGILRKVRPNCVLGMGGFVTGPGGMATWLTGRKLLIHEQNAVAGVSNKILALFSYKVMEAFPGTFRANSKVASTGNPVRASIVSMQSKVTNSSAPLNVLILGGSQGAVAINELIPEVLGQWQSEELPAVIHQTGERNVSDTLTAYQAAGFFPGEKLVVKGFVNDMAKAYAWADIVICRSGASTVCELAVAGLPSILIPYPHHQDNQQIKNAEWLCNAGAAILIQQAQLTLDSLSIELKDLSENRTKLNEMSAAARQIGTPNASKIIADICLEAAGG